VKNTPTISVILSNEELNSFDGSLWEELNDEMLIQEIKIKESLIRKKILKCKAWI
jgi:hypothetical protein